MQPSLLVANPGWLNAVKWLTIATLVSSILHYVDNVIFFADYPEPVWINPGMVDVFWLVMTPLAPLGYKWMKQGHLHLGAGVLVLYGLCNMLSLGHYNYAPMAHISAKIHLFILIEAVLALGLIGVVLMACFPLMKPRT